LPSDNAIPFTLDELAGPRVLHLGYSLPTLPVNVNYTTRRD